MADTYKKVKLIGTGTFGKVWLVEKEQQRQKYVLKEVQIKGMSDKDRTQSLTEVEALAKCRHYNVVRYKDAFVADGALNIVMEYAQGGDLEKQIELQNGVNFEEEFIMDWFVQICFGLKYIHGLNIIHRDLKTLNIFLSADNIIKIGDFGISRILQDPTDRALTTIGTPYYLSPEICNGLPYDQKSDIWSLGCVLYNLCSLKPPFEASTFSGLVGKITHGKVDPIPEHYSTLLNDYVQVLLRNDPVQRPTAGQLLCTPKVQPYINAYVHKTLAMNHTTAAPSPVSRELSNKRHHMDSPGIYGKKQCVSTELDSTPQSPSAMPYLPYRDIFQSPSPANQVHRIGRTYTVQSPRQSYNQDVCSSPKLAAFDSTREPDSTHNPLVMDITRYFYSTCAVKPGDCKSNSERLHAFLEGRLGVKVLQQLLCQLREGLASNERIETLMDSSYSNLIYVPLCLQLIQLENISTFLT